MERYDALHELARKFEHLQAARYHVVAPVVVLYYDFLLTLSLEIDRFWRQPRLTGPTVLFVLNRYCPILAFIPTMVVYFSDTLTHEVCKKFGLPFAVSSNVVSQSVIAMVLALRTYALYQQSFAILVLVSLAWAAATAVGAWGASGIALLDLPPGISGGCVLHIPDEGKFRIVAAYTGSLAFDAFIYGLTLWRSYTLHRARRLLRLSGDSLLTLVVRDGSVYFFVLLASNILSILLILSAEPDLRVINVTFTHIIPVTITSRLLLNLRKDVRRNRTITAPDMTMTLLSVGDSDFLSAVLGNIGESFEEDSEDNSSRCAGTARLWDVGGNTEYAHEEIGLESIEVSELRLGIGGGR